MFRLEKYSSGAVQKQGFFFSLLKVFLILFMYFFSNCFAFRMSHPQTVTTVIQSCCDNHKILVMEKN